MMLPVLLLTSVLLAVSAQPEVTTTLGPVVGSYLRSGVDQFLGIPYASAARFAPAVLRTEPFPQQPLHATTFGPACLQFWNSTYNYGSEHECFVLNIWRPSGAKPGLPVLLYVPGGENAFGEASPYNSSQLAVDQHALVASLNYRVGPFGFVAFDEDVASGRQTGNWAQSDIQAALRWLKREIAAFGGDSSRITLFGQSSGGGLVLGHAVMPGSKGLVQGLISQSGGVDPVTMQEATNITSILTTQLNCTARGFTSPRQCLLSASADDIVQAQGINCINPSVCTLGTQWAPTVDGIALPAPPAELLRSGRANLPIDLVLGANTNDSNLFVSSIPLPLPAPLYKTFLKTLAAGNASRYAALLDLYPPHSSILASNLDRIGWITSDQFLCSTRRLAHLHADAGVGTHLYRYDYWYRSNKTCTAVANYHDPSFGSMHQDELSFVFGQPIFMDLGGTLPNCSVPGSPYFDASCVGCFFDAQEEEFAEAVGERWVNFAASGDPNQRAPAPPAARRVGAEWPAIAPNASAAVGDRNIILIAPLVDELARLGGHLPMQSELAMGDRNCDLWDQMAADTAAGSAAARAAARIAARVALLGALDTDPLSVEAGAIAYEAAVERLVRRMF